MFFSESKVKLVFEMMITSADSQQKLISMKLCFLSGSFSTEWKIVGQSILSKRHIGAAQQYLKQGCVAGLRKNMWKILFDLEVDEMVSIESMFEFFNRVRSNDEKSL